MLADLTETCFHDSTNVSEGYRTHKYEDIRDAVTSEIIIAPVVIELCKDAEFVDTDNFSYLQDTVRIIGETPRATGSPKMNMTQMELGEFPKRDNIDIRDTSVRNEDQQTTLYHVVNILTESVPNGIQPPSKAMQSEGSDEHTEDAIDACVDETEAIRKKENHPNQVDVEYEADIVTDEEGQGFTLKMMENVAYESCSINFNIESVN